MAVRGRAPDVRDELAFRRDDVPLRPSADGGDGNRGQSEGLMLPRKRHLPEHANAFARLVDRIHPLFRIGGVGALPLRDDLQHEMALLRVADAEAGRLPDDRPVQLPQFWQHGLQSLPAGLLVARQCQNDLPLQRLPIKRRERVDHAGHASLRVVRAEAIQLPTGFLGRKRVHAPPAVRRHRVQMRVEQQRPLPLSDRAQDVPAIHFGREPFGAEMAGDECGYLRLASAEAFYAYQVRGQLFSCHCLSSRAGIALSPSC